MDLNTLIIFVVLSIFSMIITALLLVLYANQRRQNLKQEERIKILEGRLLVQFEDRICALEEDAVLRAVNEVKAFEV